MKKLLFSACAALVLAGMAACSGKQAAADNTADETAAEKTAYTGILPAADCDGVWYTLQLNDGKYDMIETYFALDTTATVGIAEILSVKSEGDYTVVEGEGDNAGKTYLKLAQATDDSAAQTLYFLQATDSTLTMVNAEFEAPATPDYYTLNQVK